MYKYQFHIAFNDKANTAASKAVQDCQSVLSEMGYRDCSIDNIKRSDRLYLLKLFIRLVRFFLTIKPESLVAVQYPLLSGNTYFKYFIKAARFKRVNFFCIIHDLDDLRYQGNLEHKTTDIEALNCYDYVIAHNASMKRWLENKGLRAPVIVLEAFDYLSVIDRDVLPVTPKEYNKIVFAGNLSKSRFVYSLDIINKWQFNLYGPNYLPEKASVVRNICWNGSLSPDEILGSMSGAFGLVWDGENIDRLDTDYGNYLKYNYPHKLSLYLAAGLPVIAPYQSAISSFIKSHGVGILLTDLIGLQDLTVEEDAYLQMRENAIRISKDLKAGKFFYTAVAKIEAELFIEEAHLETISIYNLNRSQL